MYTFQRKKNFSSRHRDSVTQGNYMFPPPPTTYTNTTIRVAVASIPLLKEGSQTVNQISLELLDIPVTRFASLFISRNKEHYSLEGTKYLFIIKTVLAKEFSLNLPSESIEYFPRYAKRSLKISLK